MSQTVYSIASHCRSGETYLLREEDDGVNGGTVTSCLGPLTRDEVPGPEYDLADAEWADGEADAAWADGEPWRYCS